MPQDIVALCRIEHDGKVYNYGQKVPKAVQEAHPTAVGYLPLTEEDIDGMSPEELREALRAATQSGGEQ